VLQCRFRPPSRGDLIRSQPLYLRPCRSSHTPLRWLRRLPGTRDGCIAPEKRLKPAGVQASERLCPRPAADRSPLFSLRSHARSLGLRVQRGPADL
jgi:hypothetical protein